MTLRALDQYVAGRRGAFLMLLGCPAVAFALLALLVAGKSGPVLSFDTWVSQAAHTAALAHPSWRSAMAAVTVTGSTALAPAGNFSFPSGHSTASAAVALITVLVCWPLLCHRCSRIGLAVVAGVWAVAVGVSRVALVVHWPSDVLGAWLFVLAIVPVTGVLLRAVLGRDGRLLTAD